MQAHKTGHGSSTELPDRRDTHGRVYSHRLSYLSQKVRKGGDFFYGKSGDENYTEGLRSRADRCICEEDHRDLKKNGSQVSGPVPLPTKKEVVTILRAVHKYKDSREQFEQRTHKRLIDIINPTQKTVDALSRLEMPAGVYIDIKMKTK